MSSAKSNKRCKPPHEFGMNNLDNTAPIKSILDELQHKNPNAYKFYCQVLGKLPVVAPATHCSIVGHNLVAFPTDWDGELSAEYYEPFAYESNHPRMITCARNVSVEDPVTEYMVAKKKWSDKSQSMLRLACRKVDLLMEGYKRLSKEVVRCPEYMVRMAEHAAREPDPRFHSHYNWYYSGRGNLHLLALHQHQYLVHSHLTCLYLTRCCKPEMEPNFNETFSFDCGDNIHILETVCSPLKTLIALRTMHKVLLLKVEETEEITFQTVKILDSKVAYTSIELDPHHVNILYATSLNDTVDVVNLDSMLSKQIILNKEPDFLNNWNTVQGFDRLHYIHATKDAIHVFDKQTHKRSYSINNYKLVCEDCNDICVIRKSHKLPNCFYFGTSHHLFCVDVRSNITLKPTLLSRWTHGMQSPPVYLSVEEYEDGKELVTLSSQWPEDVTFIVNDAARLHAGLPPECTVMPFKPWTIFDSLSEARSKKLCLDPTLHIDRRLSTAITGLLVVKNDEKFHVYLQNSLGDISLQTLYPEHLGDVVPKDFSEYLNSWSESLRIVPEKMQVTEVLDLSVLRAHFQTVHSRDVARHKRRKSQVKFSENAIEELVNSEGFDDGLLAAWNVEGSDKEMAN